MTEKELSKISSVTKNAFSFKHGRYDFGSWQALINKIGWDEIEKYDQLILVNDSCYGPLFDLKNIFENCELKFDYWGITESFKKVHYVQSYFLVMNNKIIKSTFLKDFFKKVKKEADFWDVVTNYEQGLSQLILNENFTIGSYMGTHKLFDMSPHLCNVIEQYQNPLIKIKMLTGQIMSANTYEELMSTIKNKTQYDTRLIENHILSKFKSLTENSERVRKQAMIFKWKEKTQFVPDWIFSINTTMKGKLLIKIFKIPVVNIKLFR